MNLHIFIGHKHSACFAVAPMDIPNALRQIDQRMPALMLKGHVAVTLDSEQYPNVTYILSPRATFLDPTSALATP